MSRFLPNVEANKLVCYRVWVLAEDRRLLHQGQQSLVLISQQWPGVRWSYWSPLIVTFHRSDAEGQGAATHTVGLCHSQRTLRLRNGLLFV